jgi:membrane fusion protein (multidrug efflux system)
VLVVGEGNKPTPRPVKMAGAGRPWVVTGGLAAGERVIVDGFQKMMPGAPVKPVPWTPRRTHAGGRGMPAPGRCGICPALRPACPAAAASR